MVRPAPFDPKANFRHNYPTPAASCRSRLVLLALQGTMQEYLTLLSHPAVPVSLPAHQMMTQPRSGNRVRTEATSSRCPPSVAIPTLCSESTGRLMASCLPQVGGGTYTLLSIVHALTALYAGGVCIRPRLSIPVAALHCLEAVGIKVQCNTNQKAPLGSQARRTRQSACGALKRQRTLTRCPDMEQRKPAVLRCVIVHSGASNLFSDNRSLLLISCPSGTVTITPGHSQPDCTWQGHPEEVYGCEFVSGDGSSLQLATGSSENVYLWDVATATCLSKASPPSDLRDLAGGMSCPQEYLSQLP